MDDSILMRLEGLVNDIIRNELHSSAGESQKTQSMVESYLRGEIDKIGKITRPQPLPQLTIPLKPL